MGLKKYQSYAVRRYAAGDASGTPDNRDFDGPCFGADRPGPKTMISRPDLLSWCAP
jgi:hypothetical protein